MPVVALLLVTAACGQSAGAACPDCTESPAPQEFSFAVLGDLPYTARQERRLPAMVDEVNADPDVRLVVHLGDIRDKQRCTDDYFRGVKAQFDRFGDPLVFTFGDNDWADCTRVTNGRYDALGRLALLRQVFAARPPDLGSGVEVRTQASDGYPENVAFEKEQVSFAAVHVVGSRNDLEPWAGQTEVTRAQQAESDERLDAAEKLIRQAFSTAAANHDRAVVLFLHADLFAHPPDSADSAPYRPLIRTLAEQSAAFDGPVFVFNGDSHVYTEDHPLDHTSRWPQALGVPAADRLTRITVDGGEKAASWVKVTDEPYYLPVLRWKRTPFAGAGRP